MGERSHWVCALVELWIASFPTALPFPEVSSAPIFVPVFAQEADHTYPSVPSAFHLDSICGSYWWGSRWQDREDRVWASTPLTIPSPFPRKQDNVTYDSVLLRSVELQFHEQRPMHLAKEQL